MKRLALIFCLGLLTAGCASLHNTGYLEHPEQLQSVNHFGEADWKANVQEKAFVDSAYSYNNSQTLQILRPTIAKTVNLDEIRRKMYSDSLYNHLNAMITEKSLYKVKEDANVDYVLDTYIGILDPGNGFMRWFFGMGMGQADFQVESKIKDNKTGSTIVGYAYRTQDTGNPVFGLNLSELDNEKQVDNAMKAIAKSYAKFLEKKFKK